MRNIILHSVSNTFYFVKLKNINLLFGKFFQDYLFKDIKLQLPKGILIWFKRISFLDKSLSSYSVDITPGQRQEISEAFALFDSDKDNQLNPSEFKVI